MLRADGRNDPTAQIRQWTQWTQWQRGLGGTPTTNAKSWAFRYDNVDQLSEAAQTDLSTNALTNSLSYGYDPAGNRTQALENGVAAQFTVGGDNRVTGSAASPTVPLRFAGTVSTPGTVTLAGQAATMSADGLSWEATVTVDTGAQSLELIATNSAVAPGFNAERTRRHVNLTLSAAPAFTPGYDDNGSMTFTGTDPQTAASYEWDAANRLTAIVKGGQRTEFTYDGMSRWSRIVEKNGTTTNAAVTSTRQIVWEGFSIAQIRDVLGGEVRNVFAEGEVRTGSGQSATNLLYIRDHLGSVRELVNVSDLATRARYDYAPYGKRTRLAGDLDCDFGFTGHYEHDRSGLTLAPFRAYDSGLGRWLSRDPIGEDGGINLYGYTYNNPSNNVDALGYDIYLKGSGKDNVPFHQKIAVDTPNGIYAISFAIKDGFWNRVSIVDTGLDGIFSRRQGLTGYNGALNGHYYNDDNDGPIVSRIKTTPQQDAEFAAHLESLVDTNAHFGFGELCRNYSQWLFNQAKARYGK